MKSSVSKIFSRAKLINNRMYAIKFGSPKLLSQLALQNIADNISMMKKTFDGNVAYFGPDFHHFLEIAPPSKI